MKMFLIKAGSNGYYEEIEPVEKATDQHYFHDAIVKLARKSAGGGGITEITLILDLPLIAEFQSNVVNKYVERIDVVNTVCDNSVKDLPGYEYFFLGLRINVLDNTDKNVHALKSQVPHLSEKIDAIGQKSVLLDTTPLSDERHIDRLGVLLKETNDNK